MILVLAPCSETASHYINELDTFEEFFEAREVLQKYNKKTKNTYRILYEKKVY